MQLMLRVVTSRYELVASLYIAVRAKAHFLNEMILSFTHNMVYFRLIFR